MAVSLEVDYPELAGISETSKQKQNTFLIDNVIASAIVIAVAIVIVNEVLGHLLGTFRCSRCFSNMSNIFQTFVCTCSEI